MTSLSNVIRAIEESFIYFANGNIAIILTTILLILRVRTLIKNIWYHSLINLTGTFLHEAMHMIVGILLFAKPTKISIIPNENSDNSFTLGKVGFNSPSLGLGKSVTIITVLLSLLILSYFNPYLKFYYSNMFDNSILPIVFSTILLIVLAINVIITQKAFNFTNKTPIALAPLLLLPLVVFNEGLKSSYFNLFGEGIISILIYIFLLIIVIINSIPSSVDIKVAVLNIGVIFWLIFFFFLIDFYFMLNTGVSNSILDFIEALSN